MKLFESLVDVSQISFDAAVTFFFSDGSALRLEQPIWIDTEPPRLAEANDLVCLHGISVQTADVERRSKSLRLVFGDGTAIRTEADEHHESWDFNRSDGVKLVMGPAGEILTWGATNGLEN